MEIREILHVNTVAEFKNLTKAAEYLHITQPSLSQSIKSIEERLNAPLFMRSKRGMELTQTGMKFVSDSSPLLTEYNLFITKLKNYSKDTMSHCQPKLSYDVLFKEKLYILMSQSNPMSSYNEISTRDLKGTN